MVVLFYRFKEQEQTGRCSVTTLLESALNISPEFKVRQSLGFGAPGIRGLLPHSVPTIFQTPIHGQNDRKDTERKMVDRRAELEEKRERRQVDRLRLCFFFSFPFLFLLFCHRCFSFT